MEEVEEIRHKKGMKELYSLRSQTIERVFADAKELYQMRYTRYRGIKRVTMELTLKFACMNLKKLAVWKDRDSIKRAISHGFWGYPKFCVTKPISYVRGFYLNSLF